MANRIILNNTSYHGKGAIKEIPNIAKTKGFTKVLVVTDPDLIKFNVAQKVTDLLDQCGLPYAVFSEVKAEDLDVLAADAYADACRPGNPRETGVEDLKELYKKIMA